MNATQQPHLLRNLGIPALISLPFVIWIGARYLNADFSYDEFFTFDEFVFVPFVKTLTDYSAPNNHIFSSILHRIYLRLIGINNLFELMDTPYKARLLDFGFSLVTLGYVYRIGQRFFQQAIAQLAVLFLVTTIPFYNYATLIRGYSLSIMLVSMLVYYAWSVEESGHRGHAVLLALLVPLLLYTIPLNIYVLLSLAAFYGMSCAATCLTRMRARRPQAALRELGSMLSSPENRSLRRALAVVGLLALGLLCGVLIYVPFYRNFINNRHFKSHGLFYANTLIRMFPQSLRYFLSERYALLPLLGLGLARFMRPAFRHTCCAARRKLICCATLVIGPFVLSFIRGDYPPSRAFVNLTPVVAIMLAVMLAPLLPTLRKPWHRGLAFFLMLLYCYGAFAYGIHGVITPRLKADIEENINRHDMYYNFFQAYYQPMKLVRYFRDHYPLDRIPVTLVFNLQEFEMRRHLDKFAIRYYQHPYEVLFNQEGQAYVVVAFADIFVNELAGFIPDVRCASVYPDINYHKILFCESAMLKAP